MKNTLRKFCLFFCCFSFVSSIFLAIYKTANDVFANEVTLSDVTLASTYTVGDELVIPQADITVDGKTYKAKTVLIMPDGKATRETSIEFTVTGKYELRYQVEESGKVYSVSKFFDVQDKIYTLVGDGACSYGTNDLVPGVNGLNVSMDASSKLRFNQPIDLREFTKDDNFIKLYVTPQTIGQAEISSVNVTLIDAHNTSNVLHITNNGLFDIYVHARKMSATRVAANNEPLTALRLTYNDSEDRYPGSTLLVDNHAAYGTDSKMSVYGTPECDFIDSYVGFRYDLGNNVLYTNGTGLRRNYYTPGDWYVDEQQSYIDAVANGKPNIDFVADLDNPNYFKNPWNGFSTGEVFVEISFGDVFTNKGNIFITSLGKLSGESLINKEVKDDKESIIDIDYGTFTENTIPQAVLGSPYKIFNAEVFDLYNDNPQLIKKIFLGYGSKNSVELHINEDETFTPIYAGTYTIEYSAYNSFGVKSIKTVNVDAVDPSEVEEMTIALGNKVTSGFMGKSIGIASYKVNNAIGNTVDKVIVTLNGENVEISNNEFFADRSGIFTIRYEITDYIGRKVFDEYTVEITAYQGPVFSDYLPLPKYFSANMKYVLPEYNAYEYTTGTKRIISCGFPEVTDSTGTKQLSGYEFTPKINTEGEKVIVKYKATFAGITEYITKEIPCYTVYNSTANTVDLSKLFITGEHVSIEKKTNNIRYTFDKDTSLEYINGFDIRQFAISFNPVSSGNVFDFKELTLYFEGYYNDKESVKITLTPLNDEITLVRINDKKAVELGNSILKSGNQFSIKYIDGIYAIGSSLNLTDEKFVGFTNNKVNFRMEFIGVKSSVTYAVSNLCGQTLSGATKDNVAPLLILNGKYSGEIEKDAYNTFSVQTAMDVVDPTITEVLFSLLSPDGKTYVKDIDGIELKGVPASREYTVKFEEYGNYIVTYTAKDCFGKGGNQKGVYIKVIDHVAPVIEIVGNKETVGNVGKEYTIADIKITDNCSLENQITSYAVYEFNGIYVTITDRKFIPKEKGEYRIIYYAFDAMSNYSSISYIVNVI